MVKKTAVEKVVNPKNDAKRAVRSVSKKTSVKVGSNAPVYQVKITLREVKPVVWRRIRIESDKTMFDLYCAILDSMGWTGYHLFIFRTSGRGGVEIGIRGEGEWGVGEDVLPAVKEPLAKWLAKGKKLILEYDFGDGWEHTVVLEKVLEREPKAKYPQCIDGERACPPEDIGGPWGYMEFLEAVKDPHNPKYADLVEMFFDGMLEEGEDISKYFTPEHFDPKDVRFTSEKELKGMFGV